ncbi:hypothetical protein BGX26_011271 [Mortierella sp. AD094]|nr:hypothetical protein BGX26_011271 [Mortierella sp. AD094]
MTPSMGFRTTSSPSPTPSSLPPTHPSSRSSSRRLKVLTLLLSFVATLSLVSAQNNSKQTILLTFQDGNGASIGQPLTIPLSECIPIDTTAFLADDGSLYASVVANDTQAALNLYSSPYCQILQSGAVGMWNNTATTVNITGIRWEGSAPAADLPGTLNPAGFPEINPPTTNVTHPGGENDGSGGHKSNGKNDDNFVLDPSKGRILVGLVSSILAIGIIIGVYQVYQAAQYIPPPKKSKKKAGGAVVGAKKIKKTEAYYKKPVKEDSGAGMGGSGFITSGAASIAENNRSSSMLLAPSSMQERSRQDRYSFASVSSSTVPTFVARLSPPNTTSTTTDSVLIDMLHDPFPSVNNTGATDLIQFGYDTPPYSTTSPSSSSPTGRGGEVLVPMHHLDSRQSPTRRTGRSP